MIKFLRKTQFEIKTKSEEIIGFGVTNLPVTLDSFKKGSDDILFVIKKFLINKKFIRTLKS